jgi:hypothetical protein
MATQDMDRVPDDQTITDAYVYLLGRMLVVRQEHIDRKAPGFAYNTIKYNPLGSADFVNPNFDVAYLEAWLAVDDQGAVALHVPQVTGRYYTAQILDEWGEVVANINERTMPLRPFGTFVVVKPGSTVPVPEGAGRVELHSSKAKLLARVELRHDAEGAVRLQHGFKLTALGQPDIADPPPVPDFDNQALLGVEIFDEADARLASALDVSPVAAQMQQKARAVAAYVASGGQARAAVDKLLHEKVVPWFIDYAFTESGPARDHWVGGGLTGNYGPDYRLRSSVNYGGIWANTSDEVVYFATTRDANGQALNGSTDYLLHFPADRLPSGVVDGYWSVILVGVPDYRVVPNDLQRYNFNSYSPLTPGPDGSLTILVAAEARPEVPESNWLPSPPGRPFSLTFRAYVPKPSVMKGDWSPPALRPTSKNQS